MAKHTLPEDRRTELANWLTANGIDPGDVLVDADLSIIDTDNGRAISYEATVRNAEGRLMLDARGDRVATEMRTVPLRTEPPKWWTPYVKPTREQLLAAVERVREVRGRWLLMTLEPGQVRRLLDEVGRALDPPAPAVSQHPDELRAIAETEAIRQLDADPHGLKTGMIVQSYREYGQEKWVFRCWGTDTCDGLVSLDHTSQQSADRARDRHLAEDHKEL